MRRHLGTALDEARLGVRESPYRVVEAEASFVLRCYSQRSTGPVLLLVPAPIKGPYIWDLAPHASVVRLCLDAGFQVFVVEWRTLRSDDAPGKGLAEYADRVLAKCVEASCESGGNERIFLAGHSLGGTLAAIFACLHPEHLRGVALLGAPLNFGPHIGAFGPLVAAAPLATDAAPRQGNIPGSLLSMLSLMASPITFGWSRMLDLAVSLADREALETCLAVERWTLDEKPIARRLFEDVWERLFRENALMKGALTLGSRPVRPGQLSMPLLAVIDERCSIAPPAAMLPFVEAAGSADKRVLCTTGISVFRCATWGCS